jgi:hypothetical protein
MEEFTDALPDVDYRLPLDENEWFVHEIWTSAFYERLHKIYYHNWYTSNGTWGQ